MQKTLSDKLKLNWQLNADKAVVFLQKLLPLLKMKHLQAKIAIVWRTQLPKVSRGPDGRIQSNTRHLVMFNEQVANLLKLLKEQNLVDIMRDNQYVDVMNRLGLGADIEDPRQEEYVDLLDNLIESKNGKTKLFSFGLE